MKKAKIFINDVWAGILTEDHDGYHFAYTSDYLKMEGAKPLSPTMPL
jgi:serine/threonine-protein kinase HipA